MRPLRLLVGTLFAVHSLYAYLYDESLLLIYAKIVPRIIALDRTPRNTSETTLCILYEKGDRKIAETLAVSIQNHYPFKKGALSIRVHPYSDLIQCENSASYLLLPAAEEKLKEALDATHDKRTLVFAYDESMLRLGATLAIHTGRRVYPVINIESLKEHRLVLDPALLQTAKIYGVKR